MISREFSELFFGRNFIIYVTFIRNRFSGRVGIVIFATRPIELTLFSYNSKSTNKTACTWENEFTNNRSNLMALVVRNSLIFINSATALPSRNMAFLNMSEPEPRWKCMIFGVKFDKKNYRRPPFFEFLTEVESAEREVILGFFFKRTPRRALS